MVHLRGDVRDVRVEFIVLGLLCLSQFFILCHRQFFLNYDACKQVLPVDPVLMPKNVFAVNHGMCARQNPQRCIAGKRVFEIRDRYSHGTFIIVWDVLDTGDLDGVVVVKLGICGWILTIGFDERGGFADLCAIAFQVGVPEGANSGVCAVGPGERLRFGIAYLDLPSFMSRKVSVTYPMALLEPIMRNFFMAVQVIGDQR